MSRFFLSGILSSVSRPVRGLGMGVALAAILMISGCASVPSDPEARAAFEQDNDPLEPLNRGIFEVNYFLDAMLLKPAAQSYRDVVPEFGREGVRSFLNNLRSPIVLANDLLQGETDRAGVTIGRFLVNTTIGLGGIFDAATGLGLVHHSEDFGQTLAVWGMGEGFYLMLPIFGPSNPRDAVGLVTEYVVDPINIYARQYDHPLLSPVRSGAHAIDGRSRNIDILDELETTSVDFYAAVRSLYRQRRIDEIGNGRGSSNVPAPSISGPSAQVSADDKD